MRPEIVRGREGGLLADRALAHIRELISTSRLGPGDRVNEMEISQHLGISRGPIREAIRRLASSGLLVPEPNLGSRVIVLDAEAVRALYEVREALEALSAGLAAQRMTPAEAAGLGTLLDEHESSMIESGASAYPMGSSDWDFHLAILRGSRNAFVQRVVGSDLADLLSLIRARHGGNVGRGRRALLEHRWIVDAITSGNADLASTLMAQHIRASRDNLLALLPEPTSLPAKGRQGR